MLSVTFAQHKHNLTIAAYQPAAVKTISNEELIELSVRLGAQHASCNEYNISTITTSSLLSDIAEHSWKHAGYPSILAFFASKTDAIYPTLLMLPVKAHKLLLAGHYIHSFNTTAVQKHQLQL